MSQRDLIDPESRGVLEELLERVPGGFNSIPDVVERRAVSTAMRVRPEVPADARVTKEDRTVPGPEGAPEPVGRGGSLDPLLDLLGARPR